MVHRVAWRCVRASELVVAPARFGRLAVTDFLTIDHVHHNLYSDMGPRVLGSAECGGCARLRCCVRVRTFVDTVWGVACDCSIQQRQCVAPSFVSARGGDADE